VKQGWRMARVAGEWWEWLENGESSWRMAGWFITKIYGGPDWVFFYALKLIILQMYSKVGKCGNLWGFVVNTLSN